MLTLSAVTYRIGGRALLDGASAQIAGGSKVGLVGRNGAGKSTLLDLIRGALPPDGGSIELPRGHRIGFLAQEAPSGEATPLEMVLAADTARARLLAEREAGAEPLRVAEIETRLNEIGAHAAPSRAARILAGLGLGEVMQHSSLADLSGGWRMRVALAALLFAEPDLLLLDEPTNHLDLEAALWLERFLRNYRRTLILVSHDRRFLNAVATVTLHLQHGKLTVYSGGFDAYLRTRTEAARRLETLARRQKFERARLWLVTHGTVRPFDGDLEEYERRVLDGGESHNSVRPTETAHDGRRATRRLAAERRRELEPLRQRARRAEETLAKLTKERDLLDRALSEPQTAGTDGLALSEVLKRRAEIVRLIEQVEVDWLAAEEAIERDST